MGVLSSRFQTMRQGWKKLLQFDRQWGAFTVILLLISGILGYLHWLAYRDVVWDTANDLRGLSSVLSNMFQDALSRADSDLAIFSHAVRGEDLSGMPSQDRQDQIKRILSDHLQNFPAIRHFQLLDAKGALKFAAGPVGDMDHHANGDWLDKLRASQGDHPILSDVMMDGTGGSGLVMALPLRGPQGELVGAAVAMLDMELFQRTVDGLNLGAKGVVALRRSDDAKLLFRRPQDPLLINRVGVNQVTQRVAAGERSGEGSFISPIDGLFRLYSFQRLEGYPLVVTVAEASEDYLATWSNQTLLAGGLELGVLALMVALFIRQRRAQSILREANRALQQGEALLQASEERFRTTFEQAAVGIVHNGFDRKLLRYNQRFCEIVGYAPEELALQSYLDFTHSEDLAVSDEAVAPLLRGDKNTVAWEKRYRRKDGVIIWVRLTASLQRNGAGVPLHFITVVEDISRRKQAEERLQSEAMRYQNLLRTASDGIHVIDEEGKLCEASESFLRMLGYSAEEAEGLTVRDWDASIPGAQLPDRIRSYMTDASHVLETRHRRRDGTVFDAEIHVRKVVLDGKRYLYASSRDVSGRKLADAARERAELELRATNARMRLVLDTAAEGIIGMDDETRIIFANRAAAGMLGWSSPEVMSGRPADQILGHHMADGRSCVEAGCSIRNSLVDGETRRVSDEVFCGPNGIAHPVEYVTAPLLVEEIPVGAVLAFHDISERKEMEEELRRSNAELEQFAYVASHDLRQPLRMITSYLGLIERQLGDGLDAELKEFLGFAVGGARRMDLLILDLLDYSRVGREKTKPELLELNDMVGEGMFNLGMAIEEAQAVVDVQSDLPKVRGNRSELVRLFQNLIGNAVKYRLPDRPCRVEVSCKARGREWLLAVKDNGIGIDPKDFERAFGVFQRLVAKEKYEGTGIGLAICRKIVERHGGRIWIESEPGQGSSFLFTFPMV